MSTEIKTDVTVENEETNRRGRLIGRFIRNGEQWWSVYWESGETTSEKESELRFG